MKGGLLSEMDKQEFLNILRISLNGEVNPVIIEQNIKYYDQYIAQHSQEGENEIMEMLGDPRLIAKTIIEAERVSNEDNQNLNYQDERSYNDQWQTSNTRDKRNVRRNNEFYHMQLKWYHYILTIVLVVVVGYILFFIGKVLFGLLFTIGFPIILIILIYQLLRNR